MGATEKGEFALTHKFFSRDLTWCWGRNGEQGQCEKPEKASLVVQAQGTEAAAAPRKA